MRVNTCIAIQNTLMSILNVEELAPLAKTSSPIGKGHRQKHPKDKHMFQCDDLVVDVGNDLA